MERQPFNESGLQLLLAELYALPNERLNVESMLLREAPKAWIERHFLLNDAQQKFLDHMPGRVLAFIGEQGSFAIGNRLEVLLEKEREPSGDDDQDKLFKPKSNLFISTDNQGNTIAGGNLVLEIKYLN